MQKHGEFLRQAIEYLEQESSSSFSQVVTQFCRENAFDLKQMLFTADLLSLDETARLLKVSSKNDPAFQVHLISSVRAEMDKGGSSMDYGELTRLLEVLAKSVDTDKLSRMLVSLCDHPDERLRSKVALLYGSVSRQNEKRRLLLKDSDPRVRANAVEALWGKRDAESLQLLKAASVDEHHRVAANGLYGLYLAGEVYSIRGILKLLRDTDLNRKLSGIWLMANTGDPRFQSAIHENLVISKGRVKHSLLNAGRRIKRRLDTLQQYPQLQAELLHFERLEKGRVRCCFELRKPDGSLVQPEELLGTQVLIKDGELKIDQYFFEARGGESPTHVAYLIPLHVKPAGTDALGEAMERAIARKRPEDEWAIHKYKLESSGSEEPVSVPAFVPITEMLKVDQLRAETGASRNFYEGMEHLLSSFPAHAGRRQIVAFLDPALALTKSVPQGWSSLFEKYEVVLHLICCCILPEEEVQEWRKLCVGLKGTFLYAPDQSRLAELMGKHAATLPASFYLSYQLSRSLPERDSPNQVSFEFTTNAGYCKVMVQDDGEIVSSDG